MKHGIGIQEIRDQYQRNEEDWYTLVLRNIRNFHAEWNNGHTFEIGPGEVCDTGIKLPPWGHGVVQLGGGGQHIVMGGFGTGLWYEDGVGFLPAKL